MEEYWSIGGGLFSFLILILDIIVVMQLLDSDRDIPSKLAWAALIFLFPIFGVLFYYAFGHHKKHLRYEYTAIV